MAIKRIEKDDLVAKGALDNLTKGAEESRAAIELLKKSLEAVVELSKQTKTKVKSSSPKDVKSQKELNELTERSNKLAKSKLTLDKELLKEKERLKQKTQAQTKALKEEVALEKTQANSLNAIRAASKKLVKERNNLNLSTSKGAKRLKEINAQLDKNNAKIQKNASALGKQKMNIGNYGSAVGKLKGALGQLGLAFGVFSLIKGSFNIVKDFGQAQADLASVLGVSAEQMSRLTEQAKELGATTTFTASQVSELQKEFAKLGFTQSEIENVTEATLLLAEATGTELGRAAEVTGSTLRAFGLDSNETQRVVDVMAKSFSSSALDMEKFAVAMRSVAPVARTAGLNIEQTTALLGTLSDRGIDASTAGTSLRNVFLELSKSGMTFEEAMAEINGATDKNAAALALFGKRGATTGVILSETADDVANLTTKLNESGGAAEEMADTQRNTLGGSLKLLQSAFEGFILKMNEAGGVGEKLRKGIKFLADNFLQIMSVLGTVIKSLITFKIAMKAINFSQSIGGLKGLVAGFKSIGTSAKTASVSARKLSTAIKGIGVAAGITLLIQLATTFYDIASGASEARRQQDLFNEAQIKGSEVTKKIIDQENERIKLEKQRLETAGVIGVQLEKKLKVLEENKIKRLEIAKKVRTNEIKDLKKSIALEKGIIAGRTVDATDFAPSESGQRRYEAAINKVNIANAESNKLIQKYNNLIVFKTKTEEALSLAITTSSDVVHDYSINIADNTNAINNNITATNDSAKGKKTELEFLTSIFGKKKEIQKIDSSIDVEKFKKLQAKQNLDLAKYNLLLANEKTSKEDLKKLNIELLLAEAELSKLGKNTIEKRIIDLETQKQIRALDVTNLKTTEDQKEEILKASIDFATELYTKAADARISKIDEEMAAAKKQSDYYKQLAANGNISAKESLAEQNQIIAQANAKKEREEKRKQRILLATSILQAYSANLANGDPSAEALTKALTSSVIVTQFVNALPAFEDGTENTSLDGKGKNVDGKGGFHALLHQNERVLTSDQNNKIGNYSNNEVAAIMEKHRLGQLMPDSQIMLGFGTQELVNKLMNVENKLDQVTKAIQNKPVPNIELGEITQSYMVINKRIESGKGTTTSKFKVK